jgi:hypothetical protein
MQGTLTNYEVQSREHAKVWKKISKQAALTFY